jgi:hypothetical protein
MSITKLYDAFETKEQAEMSAQIYKELGVEIVLVKRVNQGRLKYGVFLGGRKSSMYV